MTDTSRPGPDGVARPGCADVRMRLVTPQDFSAVHRVRTAVHENQLTTTVVTQSDYERATEQQGRGWLVEVDGLVVAFCIALRTNGSIWALFVEPDFEGQGHGGRLLDQALGWLAAEGVPRVWLNTESGTRAEGFYRSRGWVQIGTTVNGEILFEREVGPTSGQLPQTTSGPR